MGVPLALTLLTQALYTIVDRIIVSFIDESALRRLRTATRSSCS